MAEEKKENKEEIEFTEDLKPKFIYIVKKLTNEQFEVIKGAGMMSDDTLTDRDAYTRKGALEVLKSNKYTEEEMRNGIIEGITSGILGTYKLMRPLKNFVIKNINASKEDMYEKVIPKLLMLLSSWLVTKWTKPTDAYKFFTDHYKYDFASRIIDSINNLNPIRNKNAAGLENTTKHNFKYKLLKFCPNKSEDLRVLRKYVDFKKKSRKKIAQQINDYDNKGFRKMLIYLYRNPKEFEYKTEDFLNKIFEDTDEKEEDEEKETEIQPDITHIQKETEIQPDITHIQTEIIPTSEDKGNDDIFDESEDEFKDEIDDEINGNLIISFFFIFFTFLDYIFAILSIINMTKLSEYLLISFYNLFISIAKIIILGLLLYFVKWSTTVTILLCLSMFNTILNSLLRLFVIIKQKHELSKEQKIIFNIPFVISIIISASFIICLFS